MDLMVVIGGWCIILYASTFLFFPKYRYAYLRMDNIIINIINIFLKICIILFILKMFASLIVY